MDMKKIGQKILFGLKWFFHSFIWVFVILLVVDLVTKIVIVNYFRDHVDPILLIGTVEKPFLQINYSINTKAAFGFGIPNNELANRIIYCIIAFIGAGAIIFAYVRYFKKLNNFYKICMMLILTGAIGNLIDRLFYTPAFLHSEFNGVVDWIDFAGIWAFVFNIADSCVVVGALVLIVYMIAEEVNQYRKNNKKEVKQKGEKVLSKEEQRRLEQRKEEEEKETSEPVSEAEEK